MTKPLAPERDFCPECGAPMTPGALRGLCPRCLVKRALAQREQSGRGHETLLDVSMVASAFIDFEVRHMIGRGGMGAVYAAWQKSLDRLVALKVLSPSLAATEDFFERFQREARVMAQLEHPNIAKVFDSGITANGNPYIVMELIRGEPITKLASEQRLTLPQKLELFRGACAGVLHAHLKGIVHRDLKPSNVLVAEQDGHAVPKVIDFGLARSGSAVGSTSEWEMAYYLLGTPGYMSPEQLAGSSSDTRSDIYSLGALLYVLLTGVAPFESSAIRKPSENVFDGENLRGDLDAIALKCLAKHPTQRYQTVAALLDDLDRFETHQPVGAVVPTAAYRSRKFLRRHAVGVMTGALFALLCVIGAILLLRSSLETRRAERLAAQRLDQGEDMIGFMLGDLYTKLDELGRLDVLEGALNSVEHFYGEFSKAELPPSSVAHRAHAKRLFGMVRNAQGQPEAARESYKEAIRLYQSAVAAQPSNSEWLEALSQSWNNLAVSHHSALHVKEAEAAYKQALEWNSRTLALESGSANWADSRASLLHNLASLYEATARLDEAATSFDAALRIWTDLLAREPGNTGFLEHISYVYENRAFLHGRKGEVDQAAEANTEALGIRQRLAQADPNNAHWQALLAGIEQNIAEFHLNQDRPTEARSWLEKHLPIRERLARQDPANVEWQAALVSALRQKEQIEEKMRHQNGTRD